MVFETNTLDSALIVGKKNPSQICTVYLVYIVQEFKFWKTDGQKDRQDT